MAHRDAQTGQLVLRLVFDGPPEAGKTTTLQALGTLLGDELVLGDGPDGRTAWFDWLEHSGGVFQGQRIWFQVVAVPGQPEHHVRREAILGGADAIVLVLDSSEPGLSIGLDHLARLIEERRNPAACPVIVQANKQDRSGSLPASAIEAAISLLMAPPQPVEVVPTSALSADGVRPLFVLAARRALLHLRGTEDHLQTRAAGARDELFDSLGPVRPPRVPAPIPAAPPPLPTPPDAVAARAAAWAVPGAPAPPASDTGRGIELRPHPLPRDVVMVAPPPPPAAPTGPTGPTGHSTVTSRPPQLPLSPRQPPRPPGRGDRRKLARDLWRRLVEGARRGLIGGRDGR